MQVLRRGGMLLVGMLGLAMVLGGCSKDKKTADMTATENAELREKIAQLEEANRQKDAQAVRDQESGWGNEPAPATRYAGNGGGGDVFKTNNEGNPQATIAGDVLFASGSADIKADARKTLDRVANELKREYNGAMVRVEGYTDSDPLKVSKKKWGTNENLSQARADAVKKYLSTKGIKSSRIETMGYGSAKPKATKAASRRVEIIVVQ